MDWKFISFRRGEIFDYARAKMAAMDVANIIELALITHDSLTILKKFFQKISSPNKDEFLLLLETIEEIDNLLATRSRS